MVTGTIEERILRGQRKLQSFASHEEEEENNEEAEGEEEGVLGVVEVEVGVVGVEVGVVLVREAAGVTTIKMC